MVSLAGKPTLAGFFMKFLLLKSILAQAPAHPGFYGLAFAALAGIVISLYYYFGVVRAIYWSEAVPNLSAITLSLPIRLSLYSCVAGIFFLGLFPGWMVNLAEAAVKVLE